MNKKKQYLAVDLGATSGRTIIGTLENGKIILEELTRFKHGIIYMNGHCFWDIYALYNEIISALKIVANKGIEIESIGIDTWGVDFVFVGEDGQLLGNPHSYRDPQTVGEPERFFNIIPREKVYQITGIQVMNFNSLYQLSVLNRTGSTALKCASKILFLPDALSYLLTGEMVTEYTIASTSQLLDPNSKQLSEELLTAVGLRPDQFAPIVYPGHVIGTLTPYVQGITGLGAIPVIAVAGHDTASAVAAVPAQNEHFAYLSSGTWSLMGIETKQPIINKESYSINITNEGGVGGTTRFLKNICGMWLLERCRAEWEAISPCPYGELIEGAMAVAPFQSIINPDDECFANPKVMTEAIAGYCSRTGQKVPNTRAEYTRCIFDSLALRYRQVLGYLKSFAPFEIDRLHIIGGGSQNKLLNQFTANSTGIEVVAGPVECTALGNVMIQSGCGRDVIAASVKTEIYTPQEADIWEDGFAKFLKVAE